MKEKNRNRNWEQHRNSFNQKNDYNQGQEDSGYGVYNQNTGGYSGQVYRGKENESQGIYNSGGQYNSGNQQDYNRVNYVPDNDDNRRYNDRDYDNDQYGNSGNAGYL